MSDTDEPRFEHPVQPQPVDALLYVKLLNAALLVEIPEAVGLVDQQLRS